MEHPPARLEGTRVVLRRATVDDAGTVAATLADNIDHLAGWLSWAPSAATTAAGQLARIRETDAKWAAGEEYGYLLMTADGSVHVGMVGLHRRIGPNALEIGYWLGADHEGRGYMTEAVAMVAEAALALEDVHRVEIRCDSANRRSAAIPARLGFRLDRVDDKPAVAPLETGRNEIWVRARGEASST